MDNLKHMDQDVPGVQALALSTALAMLLEILSVLCFHGSKAEAAATPLATMINRDSSAPSRGFHVLSGYGKSGTGRATTTVTATLLH